MSIQIEEELNQEEKYNKNQLLPRLFEIAEEIIDTVDKPTTLDKKLLSKIIGYLMLYKQLVPNVFVGLLFNTLKDPQAISDALDKATDEDYIDWDGTKFITKYVPSKEQQKILDMYCYPLPLYIKPAMVHKNQEDGYHIKLNTGVVLKSNIKEDVNLDYINQENSVELELNEYAVNNNTNSWHADMNKGMNKAMFDRFNNAQQEVLKEYKDRAFYLTWKYDRRGRSYSQGYHINIQSNDYGKSLINFKHKEIIEN